MAIQIFLPSGVGAFHQGEIITGFTQPQVDVEKLRASEVELLQVQHPYLVVLSQECDLEHDFARRQRGETDDLLEGVLFCAATQADDDFRHGIGLNRPEWRKLIENREPRFHYLRAVSQEDDAKGEGLPELVVDFKGYFTLPTAEAYHWLDLSARRCHLASPYLEHLSNRFAAYMSRVGLPLEHHRPLPGEEPGQAATSLAEAIEPVPDPNASPR